MRRRGYLPALILTVTLGMALPSAYHAFGQAAAQEPANTGQGTPTGNAEENATQPAAQSSDWNTPTEPRLGPSEDIQSQVETSGSGQEPTIEWRPAAEPEDSAEAAAQLAPRVDLGGPGTPKWKVITYVSQKTTIDDNIFISHDDKQSDVYFSVAPGFAAGWGDFRSVLLKNNSRFADEYGQTREPVNDPANGDYAFVNYTATATHFVSHDSEDAVDQDAAISAQWDFTKLLLGFNARFQTLTGPDVDVGTRTRRDILTIALTANYSLSDKTSLDFDAGGVNRTYITELNSSDWNGQVYLDYQMFPKTTVGAGIVAGVRTLQTSPDQYYEQAQLRANYVASGKLSMHVNGGLEADEGDGGTKLNPVFGVGAVYSLGDQDSITLDASRQTSSSAVTTGETVETTGVDIAASHRIYSTFSIACSVGYQHADYYANGLSDRVRTDNYLFVRPSLAYDFAQWSQIELAYEYHRNVSTSDPFDFAENIASLQFNFVF